MSNEKMAIELVDEKVDEKDDEKRKIKNRIIYNKVSCPYCEGQIMSIYIGQDRICSRCIKCKRDIPNYDIEPKPVCVEEHIGHLMAAYKN